MKSIIDRFKKESNVILSTVGFKTGIGKIVGLDIGHVTFRAARINEADRNAPLKNTVIKKIGYLKDLNSELNIRPDEKISVNFHGDNVVVRRVSIPVMPKEEIKTAIRWQLKDNVQFDIEKARIKFEVLGERQDESGAGKIDVAAIVYKEEEIEKRVDLLRGYGLNVSGVFLSELALIGYVKYMNIISPRDKAAIIDIGSKRTNISIVENGKLYFSRDMNIGGDDITEAMTGVLVSDKGRTALSMEEAEKVKRERGIPESDINLLSLMRPVLERLASQIKRSLEYYEQVFHDPNIENIILAGNGAKLKGLEGYLLKETGFKVLATLPETACCAGLPLISDSDLNIIPRKFTAEKKRLLKHISARMIFVIVGALFLVFYGFLSARAVYLKNEIRVVKQHWEGIKDISPIKKRVVELTNAIAMIRQAGPEMSGIMKDLSYVAPDYVMLDDLNIQEGKSGINISGIILRGERLTEFMQAIEESGSFENVKLKFSRKMESYSPNAMEFGLAFDAVK